MKISILGAGALGGSLAQLFVQARHQVSVANSREPETLARFAGETSTTPVSVIDLVLDAEVIVISIPTKAILSLPKGLFAGLSENVVVIDTCNYHPELRDGHINAMDDGVAESQWVAQQIGFPVVKAFNNILATNLVLKSFESDPANRIALSAAGDSPTAKAICLRLIEELGFDAVDAGSLEESWRQQTGAPAYCADLNAASLRLALAGADRRLLSHYRAKRETDLQQAMEAQALS